MTTGEQRCDWWSVLLGDDELFTDVQLPAHITDEQFISLLQQISETVESVDCSECSQLSQEAFISITRTPVTLSRLRRLCVPTDLTLPNAVFETLASSGCLPALQCIDNIQPGSSVCDPLRCQAYFKQADLRVLNDCPVSSYGRARRLLLTDSSDHRQRRQRWEADLAKAAISCTMIDTYRCCRGLGYVDDKSIERLSVLFPRLSSVELRLCSVTDDGLSTFCRHNKSRDGGLSRLILDHPGDISDRAVMTLADHSPCLAHLTLSHCRRVTNVALRYLVSRCAQLTELSVDLNEAVDVETLQAISTHCRQLHLLRLYSVNDQDCSGLNAIWSNCTQLRYVTLQGCPPHLNDTSLLMMSQRCRHLVELSVASDQLTVRGLISAMMRASHLQRLCIHGNTRLQQRVDMSSVAEEIYHQLSDDVTCRASALKSLVVTSCSSDVIQLLTALCSQLLHLQIIDCSQGGGSWTDTLAHVLDNCPQLHTLDVSSVGPVVTDAFVVDVCDRAVELRRLAVHIGPHKPPGKPVSCDLLTAIVSVCPSLSQLWLTLPSEGGKIGAAEGQVVDVVVEAVRQYHGGLCHRHDVSLLSGNCHQIQLAFTPLKLLSAVASCPYLT